MEVLTIAFSKDPRRHQTIHRASGTFEARYS